MGLKELIQKIQQQEIAAREMELAAEKTTEEERGDAYSENLPQAILQQKALFEELKAIGIIDLINQMIYPELSPATYSEVPTTTADGKVEVLKIAMAQSILPEITETNRKDVEKKLHDREWRGNIKLPDLLQDRSFDTTLHILIEKDPKSVEEAYCPMPTISLDYYENKMLRIKGEKVTFLQKLTKENSNSYDFEKAIAEAFLHPRLIPVKPQPPLTG